MPGSNLPDFSAKKVIESFDARLMQMQDIHRFLQLSTISPSPVHWPLEAMDIGGQKCSVNVQLCPV
jgi:hypothetical protein